MNFTSLAKEIRKTLKPLSCKALKLHKKIIKLNKGANTE